MVLYLSMEMVGALRKIFEACVERPSENKINVLDKLRKLRT